VSFNTNGYCRWSRSTKDRIARWTRSGSLRRRGRGFTLMELLVVIAIIAVLASVVAPSVFRNVGDAKHAAALSQIELFATALNQYRLDNDGYPSTEQGLAALRTMPAAGDPPPNWRGPYLSRIVPLDPWGRPYLYVSPGIVNPLTFDLYSLGRDGKTGGDGEDADVTSWGGPLSQ
jgi:general secretion pathway protein G